MNISRRATALVATATAAVAVLGMSPAQSADIAASRITVRASDTTPASGQTFRLRGFLTSEGVPVEDATVRVKTFRDGRWVALPGAVVLTHEDGHYGVRVILQMKGPRQLRVVGNPMGDDIRTARRGIVVTVH